MDRRTTSAIVVLALAAIVVIAAWLLRADAAPAPAAELPDARPAVSGPRSHRGPSASPMPEAAARAAAEPPAAPPPAPPAEVAAPAVPRAERLLTPEERELRKWGPKGRAVEAGTGTPLAWKSMAIQVRRPENPAAVEIRRTERGATPEGDPEGLSHFDLSKADLVRGDATLADAPPGSLEYRVVAQAWGYRRAITNWLPLGQGPSTPDMTIALERDELAELAATVRNEDGSPFRGSVVVDLLGDDGPYEGVVSGRTDESGRARLPGLPSGAFEIVLRARFAERRGTWQLGPIGTPPQRISLPSGGSAEAEFVVPASGEIEIAWLDAEGADVRGWAIHVKSAQREVHYSSPETRVTGVLPGRIELELQAKGYRTWKSTVQVVAGQVTKVEARFEKGEDPK